MRTQYFAIAALCAVSGGCATGERVHTFFLYRCAIEPRHVVLGRRYRRDSAGLHCLMHTLRHLAIAMLGLLMLSGCAVSPLRINESTYRVELGSGIVDELRVSMMYTCASLTLEKGFDLMLLEPAYPTQNTESYVPSERVTGSMPLGWYARQNALPSIGDNSRWKPRHNPYVTVSFNSDLIVSMYRRPLPYWTMAAIDARKMKELLQPFIDDPKRLRQMPEIHKLIRQATVAHVKIGLPTADQVKVVRADSEAETEVSGTLRDASEFVDQFEAVEGHLYSLYDYRRRESAAGGGTVVLSLTVAPDGRVTKSHVVSTTVEDEALVSTLRVIAARFSFFREEVVATRAELVPIVFTPSGSD